VPVRLGRKCCSGQFKRPKREQRHRVPSTGAHNTDAQFRSTLARPPAPTHCTDRTLDTKGCPAGWWNIPGAGPVDFANSAGNIWQWGRRAGSILRRGINPSPKLDPAGAIVLRNMRCRRNIWRASKGDGPRRRRRREHAASAGAAHSSSPKEEGEYLKDDGANIGALKL